MGGPPWLYRPASRHSHPLTWSSQGPGDSREYGNTGRGAGAPKSRTSGVLAAAGLSDWYENEWIPSHRWVPAFRRSEAGPVPRHGAGTQGKGKTAIQWAKTRRPTIFILQCGLRRAMSFLDRPLSPKRIYRMSEAPWKMNDR